MSTPRTDPHRPGAIVPAEYASVFSYILPDAWAPGWGVDCTRVVLHAHPYDERCQGNCPRATHAPDESFPCCVARLREQGVAWAATGGTGKCSVCGANYKYGSVWKHLPTGEHIHVGHDCADKYEMLMDWSSLDLERKRREEMRASVLLREKREATRDEFLSKHPGLAEAFAVEHDILRDMASKLYRFGSLSDKQVAFALRLADQVRNPPPPEQHVPAPSGRVDFEGTVVAVKDHASDFGMTWKMTVKVVTPEGSWLAWLTVPSAAWDAIGQNADLRGKTIRVRATLSAGREAHFAFGKRPTLLGVA